VTFGLAPTVALTAALAVLCLVASDASPIPDTPREVASADDASALGEQLLPVPVVPVVGDEVRDAAAPPAAPGPQEQAVARGIAFEEEGRGWPTLPAVVGSAAPAAKTADLPATVAPLATAQAMAGMLLPVNVAAGFAPLFQPEIARPTAAPPTSPVRFVPAPLPLRTEDELRRELAELPEVGLGAAGANVFYAFLSRPEDMPWTDPAPIIQTRPDMRQLPFHGGAATQLKPRQATTLDELSRKIRVYLAAIAPVGTDGRRANADRLAMQMLQEKRGRRLEWLRVEAIPALTQLLMHEDTSVRRVLSELLGEIPHPAATRALAQRAVFDTDAAARSIAVDGLRDRAPADYRPILLKALRYPWVPAADHAAEVLVALNDRGAVAELVSMLGQPDPLQPRELTGGRVCVQEVVRVSHLTNCILCHPPSLTGTESASLGVDPVLTMSFPKKSLSITTTRGGRPSTPSEGQLDSMAQQSLALLQSTPGCHNYTNLATLNPPSAAVTNTQQSVMVLDASQCSTPQAAARIFRTQLQLNEMAAITGKVGDFVNLPTPPIAVKAFKYGSRSYFAAYVQNAFLGSGPPGQPRQVVSGGLSLSVLPLIIRGDITYLRQDFSVLQPTAAALNGGPPTRTRFDYFVRTRNATAAEKQALNRATPAPTYPQREAVLYALRGLTGVDEGPTTVAWQSRFPQTEEDVEGARLCRGVLKAAAVDRRTMLQQLRDKKGITYTIALASAIPSLNPDLKDAAREYLVERMMRMTDRTLRDKLADDDDEVRRAAVLACGRKKRKELVPDLIGLLDHAEPTTARLAEDCLRELTNRDFTASAGWQAWWQREGRASGGGL
jgi:HEAT repeat protein